MNCGAYAAVEEGGCKDRALEKSMRQADDEFAYNEVHVIAPPDALHHFKTCEVLPRAGGGVISWELSDPLFDEVNGRFFDSFVVQKRFHVWVDPCLRCSLDLDKGASSADLRCRGHADVVSRR